MSLASGWSNAALLHPKGAIGESELMVIGLGFALMLIVVVPVVIMALWFPRRYRASDPQGDYAPHWSHSTRIDIVVWAIPALIVIALGTLSWHQTHALDPFEPIAPSIQPLSIQVVSLDWKWLFIYPEQNVATINQLVLPEKVPLRFTLTSDSVVTSFFIPQLGSQIYAMAGMRSQLHLLANEPGVYFGQNEQFSGSGFAQMTFKVTVTSRQEFSDWLRKTALVANPLNHAQFAELRKPGIAVAAPLFSPVEHGLFDRIVESYQTSAEKHPTKPNSSRTP